MAFRGYSTKSEISGCHPGLALLFLGEIVKYLIVFKLVVALSLPNLAFGAQAKATASLEDECAKTLKEVEDMFEYHNTLEVMGDQWGDHLDRAMRFLDWCVKHNLIKIQ